MEITLEALGLKQADIADKVVDRIVERMLSQAETFDEDGDITDGKPTRFSAMIQTRIKKRIDDAVEGIAGKHLLPNLTEYLETFCLQETTSWGEKKCKPVTFIEYLVQRADAYMKEKVNHQGKTKEEDSYSWRENTTRVSYLIHEHLQYNITRAMKEALTKANASFTGGIEAAVRTSLNNLTVQIPAPVVKEK